MIDTREPQNYHTPADPIDTAYSDIDRQAHPGETEEVRMAREEAFEWAKPASPASPDDIDKDRNEHMQDEMGRQLGRGVVGSLVSEHEIVASQHEVISSQPETEINASIETMLTLCALVISYRAQELQQSKALTRRE